MSVNKVVARRKQQLNFIEGKLWSLRLVEAMLAGVSDPRLIHKELDNLKGYINAEKDELVKQIEGGEKNDKRSEPEQRPTVTGTKIDLGPQELDIYERGKGSH